MRGLESLPSHHCAPSPAASPWGFPSPQPPSLPPTIVRLHQLLDQVQTEPGAAVAARGAHVHLLERAEDLTELVLRNAQAGVSHGQVHAASVLAGAATDSDGAIAGELGCG